MGFLFSNMWIKMEISVWEDYLYPPQHLVFNAFNIDPFQYVKFAILSKGWSSYEALFILEMHVLVCWNNMSYKGQ
ncbi:hypothetical protein P8452_12418 [Trifolium repens]|nr:hypothetical protein P8452_12418 [Trifolium repens]